MTTGPYLTVEEASQLARCSTKTIRRAVAAGELRAFKPTARVLIRDDDLRAWVERRTAAAEVVPRQPDKPRRRVVPGSVQRLREIEREAEL